MKRILLICSLLLCFSSNAFSQLERVDLWINGYFEATIKIEQEKYIVLSCNGELIDVLFEGDASYGMGGKLSRVGSVNFSYNMNGQLSKAGSVDFSYDMNRKLSGINYGMSFTYDMSKRLSGINYGISLAYDMSGRLYHVDHKYTYSYNMDGKMNSGTRRFKIKDISFNIRGGM